MVRIGVWGAFDVEDFGSMLGPRIVRTELAARLPDVELRLRSPIGYVGLNRFEDGEPAAPLGAWSDERISELATEIDVLIIGPGDLAADRDADMGRFYGLEPSELIRRAPHRFFIEGLGKHEVDLPTAWHAVGVPVDPTADMARRLRAALAQRAYVSVRDEASRERLLLAGVEREVLVVPDPLFLVPRIFSRDGLADRVRLLRERAGYPGGDTLLVQGGRSLLDRVDDIADAVSSLCRARGLTPVAVETGPIDGDGEFAAAIVRRLPEAIRMPADSGAHDLAASIAWSAGFVGSSLHGNIVAAAYDRPGLMLNLPGRAKREGAGRLLGMPERVVVDPAEIPAVFGRIQARGTIAARVDDLCARLDEHFGRLAELASSVEVRLDAPPVLPGSTLADERERYALAVHALGARMAEQQAAFADRERDLAEWIKGQAAQIVEKDIRFTKLWRRLHDADRHYAWHKGRADDAEELIERQRAEIEWLGAVADERQREVDQLRADVVRLLGRRRWIRRALRAPGRVIEVVRSRLTGHDV
jgi:polysaccharide pyruvyl transferase WcaK-like protein